MGGGASAYSITLPRSGGHDNPHPGRRSSLGLLTPEEKAQLHEQRILHEQVKQNAQRFVIDYLYYSIPVKFRNTVVERLRGVNGAIRPPPSLDSEDEAPLCLDSNDVMKIPVLWVQVDRGKLEKAYSQTAADRLMGFYCRGAAIDDHGNLYIQPRHRDDTMLFIHGEQLKRCQTVPDAPEPPTLLSSTRMSLLISWGLPTTEDHPLGIVDKFEVQYQRETSGYTWIALASRDVFTACDHLTQHDFTGLLANTGFRFRVRCHNRWGWGEFSQPSPVFCTLPDRPPRPGKPFPSFLTSTTIVLHWRPTDSTLTSPRQAARRQLLTSLRTKYVLRVCDKDGGVTLHQTGTLNSYVLSELQPGGSYTFEVEASNQSGTSGFSQPTRIRLLMRDPLPPSPEQQSSFYTLQPSLPSGRREDDAGPMLTPMEDAGQRGTSLAEFEYALRAGENWIELWEPVGEQIFYFNVITGERQQQAPPEFVSYMERQAAAATAVEARQQPQEGGLASDAPGAPASSLNNAVKQEEAPPDATTAAFRIKRANFWRCLHRAASSNNSPKNSLLQVSVKRSSILIDSFMAFMNVQTKDLRKRTKVHFEGEDGIDSGGLTKDWYIAVSRAFRAPSHHRFFRTTAGGRLEVEYEEVDQGSESRLEYMKFLGKFIAKAIFDRQNVDLPLCTPLYKQMLQIPITMEDVEELDSALFRSLQWMGNNVVEGILFEKFSVIVKRKYGKEEELELCEGGIEKNVTDENKDEYIQLMAQWRAKFAVAQEVEALLEGMQLILMEPSLKEFTVTELDLLLNGQRDISVDQIRAYAVYQGGSFHDKHLVILWLWQALNEFTNEQRSKFLRFATGSDRIPLDGFTPAFTITEGVDMDRAKDLPRSHTCFNQLVLPAYRSYGVLYEKLLYAIENSVGFAMT